MSALHFLVHNSVLLAGVAAASFLLIVIVMIVRMLGESKDGASAGGSVEAKVDLGAIEGVMKRVLSTQSLTVSAPAAASSAPLTPVASGDQSAEIQQALREREERIEQLSQELTKTKADLATAASRAGSAPAASGGDGDSGKVDELNQKIDELQARLAEYEIIEDDIADLSLFKDENVKLRAEVEALKAQLATAGTSAPAAPSRIKSDDEAELKFEKADKFELDPNDDIMKQFAAAVDVQPAVVAQSVAPVTPVVEAPVETQPAASDNPQDDIDKMLAEAEAATQAAVVKAFGAPESSPQDEIDAMFAAASGGEKIPGPAEVDPQAAIDATMAQAEASLSGTENAPTETVDSQAKIDEMFTEAAEEASKVEAPIAAAPAQAAEVEDESPFGGALDTEKMLDEVANLGLDAVDESSALSETLDTDKLLAEVGSFEGAQATDQGLSAPQEDDLLAEFKDTKKSG